MSRAILIFTILATAGCSDDKNIDDYRCTDAQFDAVKAQTEYCKEKASGVAYYCFKNAKITLCDTIPKGQP